MVRAPSTCGAAGRSTCPPASIRATRLPRPLYSIQLAGLPPAFILTAEYDTLRDEGEAYARKLIEAGNLVQVRRTLGAIHGFFAMPGALQIARDALREVAAFLRPILKD